MNKNILIVLGGAVAVALLVAVLVQVSLGGGDKESNEERMMVLVASKDLGIGRELQEGDLRWQSWPKGSVFAGAVIQGEDEKEPHEVLTGRLRRDVAEGEPVLKTALLGESKGNFVAASLEPGMRAVAVKTAAQNMVAGFLGPGDFVDVILTYRETIRTTDKDPRVQAMIELNLDKTATETILQNVRVLAIDQSATRPEDEKVKVGKTVTLAVTAQDAERLALAVELGEITLALRGIGDDKVVVKEWPTISDARLTKIGDEIFSEYEKLKKESGHNSNTVRVYNGDQAQNVGSP
jgi:pilus assembly protein CpaB